MSFLNEYWTIIAGFIGSIFIAYKYLIERKDLILKFKKTRIEILDGMGDEFLTKHKDFVSNEKLNVYFSVDFSSEKMQACMESYDPRCAINILKKYYNIIGVDVNGKLVPSRGLEPKTNRWFWLSWSLLSLLLLVSLWVLFFPFFASDDLTGLSKFIISIICFVLFLIVFNFAANEISSFISSRKFFKKYCQQVNPAESQGGARVPD